MNDTSGLLISINLLLLPRLIFWADDYKAWHIMPLSAAPVALLALLEFQWQSVPSIILLATHGLLIYLAERSQKRMCLWLRIIMLPAVTGALLLAAVWVTPQPSALWYALRTFAESIPLAGAMLLKTPEGHITALTAALLFVINEPNLLARHVLNRFPQKPDEGQFRAGKLIGLLERLLLFAAFMANSYESIAIIIGLKGLARFKKLDDQGFAEYFLIGTLLSLGSVIAAGILVRQIISS